MATRSAEDLAQFLRSRPVVQLGDIKRALDDASDATAFRYLAKVPYRTSYNHNGRFYTYDDPNKFDELGLFSHGDVLFCRDGSLHAAVQRLVEQSEAGRTHRELKEILHVRVQPFLLALTNDKILWRKRLAHVYHYFHGDHEVRREQLGRRKEMLEAAQREGELDDLTIIRVLLVVIAHPASMEADVVRHLRGYSPPVTHEQVQTVFRRYQLGEKGGPRIF